jgi:hypothetical protein
MCMRLHINLDDELIRVIDEVVGPRGRSKYIREALAEKVAIDQRIAARRRFIGSIPDFAPWMTPEWISEGRKRSGEARDRKLEKH